MHSIQTRCRVQYDQHAERGATRRLPALPALYDRTDPTTEPARGRGSLRPRAAVPAARGSMLTGLLHRLVAQPRVYELVQVLAGLPVVHRRLARQLARLPTPAVVLDLGGGTGISRPLLPRRCTYICLDM